MKRVKLASLMAAVCIVASCNTLEFKDERSGSITLSISGADEYGLKGGGSFQSIPDGVVKELDTNNFTLSIYSENGLKVYDGKYGKRPGEFVVVPGAYDVKLHSHEFNAPAFDSPLFGDEQTVMVGSDMGVNVLLACRQLNSAVRLNFTEAFRKKFAGTGLLLKDMNGEMEYPYTAGRFCYVEPGAIELIYRSSGADTLLCTRQIPQGRMLTLNLSYAPGNKNSSSISIAADTAREWVSEGFNVGHRIPTGACTIEQAKGMVGEKSVTVFGFILGGDASETSMRIAPPFSSKTNIVIAPSMLERNRNNCFVVELPTGSVRDGLNLVSYPEYLGKAVIITGNVVESYHGYTGIKGTKAFAILY